MPPRRPGPVTPDPTSVGAALRAHEGLARLSELLDGSRRRLKAIEAGLPSALRPNLQPGPLDETGWTLLAANGAVAAKLRQLLPRLEALLSQAGLEPAQIRIRILKK
jgi:hypothetical protein